MLNQQRDFKTIPGFKCYKISKTGRIYSTLSNKFLPTKLNIHNYECLTLKNDLNIYKTVTVHRLVAKTYLDNLKNLPCVYHKDDNKLNNSVDNLEWCT